MKSLSAMTERLLGQPMFALLGRVQQLERDGRHIIHYEIGDPSFDSPDSAIEAAKTALDQGLTHYTNSFGLAEFREAVAESNLEHLGFKPSVDQVLISPANAIIDFTIRCVANPGDEVIYPDPGFPTFFSAIHYNGMIPVGVPLKEENDFRMDPKDIEERITEKTRLIIINSPNNPTGSVLSETDILEIARIAKKHDVYLLTDETYSRMVYDVKHFSPSVVDQCMERTIILNSLSKVYSMSGWRLGYAIGPRALIEKMGLLLQTIISCLPAFTQYGGIAALKDDQDFVTKRDAILKERRDRLISGLNDLPGVSCVVPQGAFYAFANISQTSMTSVEYSNALLQETGVCLLPGSCFGQFGNQYIRLSYASTPVEVIEESLEKMMKFHTEFIKEKDYENAKTM